MEKNVRRAIVEQIRVLNMCLGPIVELDKKKNYYRYGENILSSGHYSYVNVNVEP
jgi:hypothetical protein